MMATNISDDGSAPNDFNLSSTIDDNESKNSGAREKCLLCNNLRRTFYCKLCVSNGDFVSSTPQNPERYADKKLLWMKLKNEKQTLSSKCLKVFEKMEVRTRLQTEINQCKGRIKLLMQLIKRKGEVIKKTNKDIETIKEKNVAKVLRLPRHKERVEKLEHYVAYSMRAEIKQRKCRVAEAESELKKIVQKNVKDLIHYIFPIYKIDAISKSGEELESTDTVSALAEATRTSYVRGKWVFMDSTGDLHYQIVAPTLPGSGDYSAYSDWVATNKNGVPGNEKMDENQAYNISAALCYTTQLVNLLAYYLDVLLPNRLSYVDFYSTDISDNKFYKKISKLNTNILYLCFSQGVDTSLLNPKHTLCNLLHLVNHSDLGRTDPFEIDSNLFLSLENYGSDMKTEEGSEDEENDIVPSEWEAIPLVPCPESSPGSTAFSTQQMPSMQATTSMAGGLVTSLASMWRGWTGNRLSEALSQSSCSTNIDDIEGCLLPEVDNSNFVNTPNVEDLNLEPTPPTTGLRSRGVQKFERRKVKRRKVGTIKVEGHRSKVAEEENNYEMMCEATVNDVNSQESISMLQEGYEEQPYWKSQFPELVETCLNSTLEVVDVNHDEEMGEGWMVKELPQDEWKDGVEKSTQTDFSIFSENKMAEKDREARNHANFIGSIMKFKVILSSRKEVSKKTFWNVLKNISTFENLSSSSSSTIPSPGDDNPRSDLDDVRREETVHTETIGYLLKTTNTEMVFLDTVKALLSYLKEALDKDLERIACCWKNSVYEMAVEIINQGLEAESGIRKTVDSFLFRIVSSILRNEGELKNFALESKTMFVINFCQSAYLCYDVINYIINKLMGAFRDSGRPSTLGERLNRTRLTNNSYFLFRILETLLVCFKKKLENEEVEETVVQETETKNFHVLEMWKKHWHQVEGPRGTGRTQNTFKVTVNKWCDELDHILVQCVKHIPICSLPGERCGRLAKDILMICHPKAMGIQKPANLIGVVSTLA